MSWSYQKGSTWRQVPVPVPGLGPLSGLASFLANLPLLGTILALIVLVLVGGVVLGAVVLFVVLGPVSIPKELASATAQIHVQALNRPSGLWLNLWSQIDAWSSTHIGFAVSAFTSVVLNLMSWTLGTAKSAVDWLAKFVP